MNLSDYYDTCTTVIEMNMDIEPIGSTLPLRVDVLDYDRFIPLASLKLKIDQLCALQDIANSLMMNHYDSVK